MLLIADSGSTKCDWVLFKNKNAAPIKIKTEGLNPSILKKEAIEIKDFGLFNPVYDNSTGYGRRMNRRVDIILWLAI